MRPTTAKVDDRTDLEVLSKRREALLRSLGGREQGPTLRAQTASHVNWRQLADQLGQPFDAERIPLSKLRQMRRDPMIAFALHYIITPLVRARWRINAVDQNGPNAQVAAFTDAVFRPIYARFVFQYLLSLSFGFQAMVKRFALEFPAGTYRDPSRPEGDEIPIWSEGDIPAWVFKSFVALRPEKVEPVFVEKTGEFDGIDFEDDEAKTKGFSLATAVGSGQRKANIDVFHSLWATCDKDSVFGDLFGYPRIGHAYRYWWSFWYRWTHADRYFERMAVPPLMVYHPGGTYEDEEGNEYEDAAIAAEMGAMIRSNGIVTLPSDLQESLGSDRASNMRQWEVKYLEGGVMNADMPKEFAQLDILKLRAMFVPEQAFTEGHSGSSSRNVAAEMGEMFTQSQSNLMAEIDDHINRFVLPQIVFANFPEFQGRVEKITSGFAQEDTDFLKQIVQLIGEHHPAELGVDIPTAMDKLGLPLMTPQQRLEQRQRLADERSPADPAVAEPIRGRQVGVVEEGDALFYQQPGEAFALSLDSEFLEGLPDSEHYRDKRVRQLTAQMRRIWKRYLREQFDSFHDHLSQQRLEFAEDPEAEEGAGAEVAAGLSAVVAAREASRIVSAWTLPGRAAKAAFDSTFAVLKKVFGRAADVELSKISASADVAFDGEAAERSDFVFASNERTMRGQLQEHLARELEAGRELDEIADDFRDHFRDHEEWQSRRVARSEVKDAYNAATLLAGKQVGVETVQAADASEGTDQHTDDECKDRDGKIYAIDDAIRVDDHPNGTLFWRLIPKNTLSVVADDRLLPDNVMACYDHDSRVLSFHPDLPVDERRAYSVALVDRLRSDA